MFKKMFGFMGKKKPEDEIPPPAADPVGPAENESLYDAPVQATYEPVEDAYDGHDYGTIDPQMGYMADNFDENETPEDAISQLAEIDNAMYDEPELEVEEPDTGFYAQQSVNEPLPVAAAPVSYDAPVADADSVSLPVASLLPIFPEACLNGDLQTLIQQHSGEVEFHRSEINPGLTVGSVKIGLGDLARRLPAECFSDGVNSHLTDHLELPLGDLLTQVPAAWFSIGRKQDLSKEMIVEEMEDLFADLEAVGEDDVLEPEVPQAPFAEAVSEDEEPEKTIEMELPAEIPTEHLPQFEAPTPEPELAPPITRQFPMPPMAAGDMPTMDDSVFAEEPPTLQPPSAPELTLQPPVLQPPTLMPPVETELTPEPELAPPTLALPTLAPPSLHPPSLSPPSLEPPVLTVPTAEPEPVLEIPVEPDPEPEPILEIPVEPELEPEPVFEIPVELEPEPVFEPEPTPAAPVEPVWEPEPEPVLEIAPPSNDPSYIPPPAAEPVAEPEPVSVPIPLPVQTLPPERPAEVAIDEPAEPDSITVIRQEAAEIFGEQATINQAIEILEGSTSGVPSDSYRSGAPNGIDINSADVEQLCKLSGIGAHTASAIISFREENGAFARVQDLKKVPGLGSHTYRHMTRMTSTRDLEATELAINSAFGVTGSAVSLIRLADSARLMAQLEGIVVSSADGLVLAKSNSPQLEKLTEGLAGAAPQLYRRGTKALIQANLPACDMTTFYIGKHAVTFAGSDQIFIACVHGPAYPNQKQLRLCRKLATELAWYCSYRAVIG